LRRGSIDSASTARRRGSIEQRRRVGFTSRRRTSPNAFAAGIDRATWASLTSDEDLPLQDARFRVDIRGVHVQDGGGDGGVDGRGHQPDFKVHWRRRRDVLRPPLQCWKRAATARWIGHAIEQSCNVYFYTIGNMTGIDKITMATLLGSARRAASICRARCRAGALPEWKQQYRREKWYAGETVSVAIGQGSVSVTPVSMAVYAATLANGGTRVTPHLLRRSTMATAEAGPAAAAKSQARSIRTSCSDPDGLFLVVNGAGTGTMRNQG